MDAMVSAVLSRRRLAAALLVALLAAAAPAGAHDDGRWGRDRGSHKKDKNKPKPTPAAPATTAVPATSAVPVTTSVPAPAPAAPTAASALPAAVDAPPALGRTVGVATVAGSVSVRVPGGAVVALAAGAPAASLPTGTRVDTRSGAVDLVSAVDAAGATQTGRFSGGVFEVRQGTGGRGMTQLVLVGGHWRGCRTGGHVQRSAKGKKPIRRLWGSDEHGRFQTRGGGSVATVRGTRWLTEDHCSGTRTTVRQGAVAVRSRRTGKVVLVRAGHSVFVAR
jgi:hypothetical protein